MSPETVRAAAEQLSLSLERERFAGWDPYDALSSPAIRACARSRLARGAAIQALRRAPVNPRPLLRVPRREHTKGLALLVSAYAGLARLPRGGRYRGLALELADRLHGRAIAGEDGPAFGYDFDVQTRWGFYPAGQPNAVVTAFAAHALLDASELGWPAGREAALGALRYAATRLLVRGSEGRFFAYYAGSTTPIHNASVLVAGVAARLPEAPPTAARAAADAVAFTVARQRPDGSWPYGEGPRLAWVDGFHTAYVLEALAGWHRATGDPAAGAAVARGLPFYLERLLDPDGAPRATVEARYPIDIHAASSAVAALAGLSAYHGDALPAAARVLGWTLRRMRRRDGRFAYRRHRVGRNAVPYVRWSDAHMLRALAAYLLALEERHGR